MCILNFARHTVFLLTRWRGWITSVWYYNSVWVTNRHRMHSLETTWRLEFSDVILYSLSRSSWSPDGSVKASRLRLRSSIAPGAADVAGVVWGCWDPLGWGAGEVCRDRSGDLRALRFLRSPSGGRCCRTRSVNDSGGESNFVMLAQSAWRRCICSHRTHLWCVIVSRMEKKATFLKASATAYTGAMWDLKAKKLSQFGSNAKSGLYIHP